MPVSTELSWEEIVRDFDQFEGRIAHMYLDTRGLVTVGVGKMLPHVAAAQKLPFVQRANGQPASAEQIAADFAAVKAQPLGKLAHSYRKFTQLELPDAAIDALLRLTVDSFEADLRARLPGYAKAPAPAKAALLDMAYNLGMDGLLKFARLKAAVAAGRWAQAAAECRRNGPSPERNEWTRDQFLAAEAQR
jgi:GH24 family phage-related lysozyme (muramidase)